VLLPPGRHVVCFAIASVRRTLLIPTTALVLLFACTPSSSQNPSASASGSAPARASAAASGTAGTSASPSSKQIALQVVVPEEGARAGVEGNGWTVDVIAKGDGAAMDRIKPAFRMTTNSGKNSAFPGLVVLVKPIGAPGTTTNASGSPAPSALPNLAGLFQIVGLPNTLGGAAGISSISTSASSSPAASASAAARTNTATDNETAEATWFVLQSMWGTNVDVELTALVVDGDAPDTVADVGQLKAVSNIVTVRFHINGSGVAPSSTVRPTPSGSTAPSVSPSGSARPSPSATP
jgi:hypothetical protein